MHDEGRAADAAGCRHQSLAPSDPLAAMLQRIEERERREHEYVRRLRIIERHFAERTAGREPPPPRDAVTIREGSLLVGTSQRKVLYWIQTQSIRVWGSKKNYRVSVAELREYAALRDLE